MTWGPHGSRVVGRAVAWAARPWACHASAVGLAGADAAPWGSASSPDPMGNVTGVGFVDRLQGGLRKAREGPIP